MEYTQIAPLARKLTENISQVIVGKEQQIELILTSLLAGGHVLLEDVPGTGKTTMAKTLAKSLSCDFSRVQFTPDLLPADITGMRIYTQNPVETQGTFPLPEAQQDRFLMRQSQGYPPQQEAVALMQRFIHAQPLATITPVATKEEVAEAAKLSRTCSVSEDVMAYMAALCEAARNPEKVRLGPSPRALLALMRCCQALAAIRGRDYVIPDDVKELAIPVLAHRIVLRGISYQVSTDKFIQELLNQVEVPTEKVL